MRCLVPPLCCALALALGCAPLQMPFTRDSSGMSRGMTREGLQQELSFFASTFAASVSTAGYDISAATRDRRVRRNVLVWRLNVVPVVQRAAFSDDPRAAYVRSLMLAVVQRRYLEVGDGRALFGDQQGVAIETARRLEEDAMAIGERFLTLAELRRVRAEVDEFAVKYPMQGREFSLHRTFTGTRQLQQGEIFSSVLSIPLSPFRALEGVDSGAQAIREFNVTARRFADIAAQLPEQLRGELELLLFDVEDRDTVVEGLAAFQSLAASADRATVVVEGLPDELRQSFDDAQSSVARIQTAVEQLRGLAEPLDAAAGKLRDASVAWREVIGSRAERDAAPSQGPGFEVGEWARAADSVGAAAAELRGLAQDAGGIEGSPALAAAIDLVFWRAAELALLVFVLALLYRVVASRLARRRAVS
jgi:hypothetical protein